MKKITMCLLGVFMPFVVFAQFNVVDGVDSAQINALRVSQDKKVVCVLTHNSLLRSENGAEFKKLAVFNDARPIGMSFEGDGAMVFVATTRGVYEVTAAKKNIFIVSDDSVVTCIELFRDKIYVGTAAGLYVSDKAKIKFRRVRALKEEAIRSVKVLNCKLYVLTNGGLRLIDGRDNVEKLFGVNSGDDGVGLMMNDISLDLIDMNKIYLATNRGLLISNDSGLSFIPADVCGLSRGSINVLIQDEAGPKAIYLGTDNGLLKLDFSLSEPQVVIAGLPGINVTAGFINSNDFFLGTAKGLFKNSSVSLLQKDDFTKLLQGEPGIEEFTKAALSYNAVHPEKIKQWRNALKMRALLPEFNIDYDKTMNYNSKDYSYTKGPRDWSVGLSWDLSELIWNSYEDDVDTRARLDTQMRLDLIDELNRIYFERLRVKRELGMAGLSSDESFARNLRLMELTAALDGYSGGWFSAKLKELVKR